ncbi:Nicotinate-nucleotide--dimethylbenzimidazole phosphoribosyltransferase [BD1-7 clade bacterium]|uniref:Nicotinate-nucleotide--dimethylbenzimidazole phosphoribosyltransferase n=1 Tax=BD1-7 clade bacterium TaxID=2029982 RepID=A0A5S9N376_9GAMM|nr:Nicotinate-nucleotide--dimethylbenzimidazole phosphoribosyltransferase [BD1-7 clade bacterium]
MTLWYEQAVAAPAADWQSKAEAYQLTLTKPPGALGRLEEVATRFSAYQNTLKPELARIEVAVMAADHGIANEGVSAFPQAVTGEMIKNFASGGAAISVLARHMGAHLTVYNLGSVQPLPEINSVVDCRIAAGTANFAVSAAMTDAQLDTALNIGRTAIDGAVERRAQLFIGGEMGIANTSSAACLCARLMGCGVTELTGPGTGLDDDGVGQKARILETAMAFHSEVSEPRDVLRVFGGFEIAALAGAFIAAAQAGIPVLVDGYIASAAALVAVRMNPTITPWLLASHRSAEPAHHRMLEALVLEPLVELSMRLGEGSGAAVTVPLIQSACRLQSEMASFAEAGVSEKL